MMAACVLPFVIIAARLDRKALVLRHRPHIAYAKATEYDPKDFLTLGNGEFAFHVDFTGLQTFNSTLGGSTLYNPLNTMAHWGWHTTPVSKSATPSARPEAFVLQRITANGKTTGYPTGCPPSFAGACKYGSTHNQTATTAWLRANPHRLNLARVHLEVNGSSPEQGAITAVNQTLDLWAGRLESRFLIGGVQVVVVTAVHPTRDVVAFQVESKLVSDAVLTVGIGFPYGSEAMQGNGADWRRPSDHTTEALNVSTHRERAQALLGRSLDGDAYEVSVRVDGDLPQITNVRSHAYRLSVAKGTPLLSASVGFAPVWGDSPSPSFESVAAESATAWEAFWESGAAVDFSGSSDARANELEGRLVLSQWASRAMEAGSLPPAETGLTGNSWYGKFHGEMFMWHCAHHIAWGRPALFERSFDYYRAMLPDARAYASMQGYRGARWFKMRAQHVPASADRLAAYTGPSPVGPLLLQQQTHPIMFSELLYRRNPSAVTLSKYSEIVESTAEFMASFALQAEGHSTRGCLNLGPPMAPGMGVEVDDPGNNYNWTGTLNGVYENTCTPLRVRSPTPDGCSIALGPRVHATAQYARIPGRQTGAGGWRRHSCGGSAGGSNASRTGQRFSKACVDRCRARGATAPSTRPCTTSTTARKLFWAARPPSGRCTRAVTCRASRTASIPPSCSRRSRSRAVSSASATASLPTTSTTRWRQVGWGSPSSPLIF